MTCWRYHDSPIPFDDSHYAYTIYFCQFVTLRCCVLITVSLPYWLTYHTTFKIQLQFDRTRYEYARLKIPCHVNSLFHSNVAVTDRETGKLTNANYIVY